MRDLTLSAWIIILFLIIFIVSLNIWLFTVAKRGNKENGMLSILRKSSKVIQNPFIEEDQQLNELANLTAQLKENATTNKRVKTGDLNDN